MAYSLPKEDEKGETEQQVAYSLPAYIYIIYTNMVLEKSDKRQVTNDIYDADI